MQSIALCRTNSSLQRRSPLRISLSSRTTALSSDAPLIRPFARSDSTSCTKPKVLALDNSLSNESRVTVNRRDCFPISGCGNSIVTSSSSPSNG